MIAFDIGVRIPGAAASAVEFDEPDAAFDQASREQAVCAELRRRFFVHAVEFLGRFGFLGEIDRFGRLPSASDRRARRS